MIESVQGLTGAGHQITVVLPRGGERCSIWDDLDVQTIEISSAWWVSVGRPTISDRLHSIRSNVLGAWELYKLIRRGKYDLIATNTITVPAAAVAAFLARAPHVWFIQEYFRSRYDLKFHYGQSLSLGIVARTSSIIILNSIALREFYAAYLPQTKLEVVDIPVVTADPTTSVPPREGLRLIMSGHIVPLKGHADAIRAVAKLGKAGIRADLDIDGPIGGDQQLKLQALIERLAIGDRVHFVGLSDDPLAWIKAADIALMCSQHEAFGRVTVEAMKMGTPVIGAASGGTKNLIEEGLNGLLYEPGNASHLAKRIMELHRDRQRMKALGEEGKRRANDRFALERHVRRLEELFKGALTQ